MIGVCQPCWNEALWVKWISRPGFLRMESLVSRGWPVEAMAFLEGMELAEMKVALGSLADSWELEDFEEVRREAKRQKVAQDREDRLFALDPSSFKKDLGWVDREGRADLSDSAKGIRIAAGRAMLPRPTWPNRFSRRSAHEKDDDQRARLEEAERESLTKELVSLLEKAGLVNKKTETGGEADQWLARRHAMGRRPSTLRQHVRLGRKLVSYMRGSFGCSWFRSVQDVMEYVALRLQEPCGKTVPGSVWSTLRFLEVSAEVEESKRLSGDGALKNFFEEVSKHPSWAEGHLRESAKMLPISVAMSWEGVVMDISEKKYVRVFAWFKLVKLWAALRWDDTLGIPPASIEKVGDRGLRGRIMRSKTTGEGKRIDVQEFYVSKASWLRFDGWLWEGWKLFRELGERYGSSNRDFLLPRPDRRLENFRGAMVKYHEAMSMSRALMNRMKVCWEGVMEGRNLLDLEDTSAFWSEHSERVTMVSWAAALGVSPEARKRWGRWKPSVDEEYAKTSLTMVYEAQEVVAQKIRFEAGTRDVTEDDLVLLDLGRWLENRGHREVDISSQLRRLMVRKGPTWKREDGLLEIEDEVAPSDGEPLRSPTEVVVDEQADPLTDDLVKDSGDLEVSRGTFVLSVVGRSKRRTLHRIGSCYRLPGVHYKEFLVVGDERPQLEVGEKLCASCFGRADKTAAEAVSSDLDVESASDSSSSTSLGSSSSEEED